MGLVEQYVCHWFKDEGTVFLRAHQSHFLKKTPRVSSFSHNDRQGHHYTVYPAHTGSLKQKLVKLHSRLKQKYINLHNSMDL